MTKTIDALGTLAAQTAMKGAADWFRANVTGISASDAADRLVPAIRKHAALALPAAMADAKEALDAGMGAAAEATFLASMKISGITAAKDVAFETGWK